MNAESPYLLGGEHALLVQSLACCQPQWLGEEGIGKEQAHDRTEELQYREQGSRRHGPMGIDPKKGRTHQDSDQQRTSLAARIKECLATALLSD
jgi:hypothetical protein